MPNLILFHSLQQAAHNGEYSKFREIIQNAGNIEFPVNKTDDNLIYLLVHSLMQQRVCNASKLKSHKKRKTPDEDTKEDIDSEIEVSELIKLSAAKGVSLNSLKSEYSEETALMLATECGFSKIVGVMIEFPYPCLDLNARNNFGTSAIMYSAIYGHPQIFQMLFEKGARTSFLVGEDRSTARDIVDFAFTGGSHEIIRLLLKDKHINLERAKKLKGENDALTKKEKQLLSNSCNTYQHIPDRLKQLQEQRQQIEEWEARNQEIYSVFEQYFQKQPSTLPMLEDYDAKIISQALGYMREVLGDTETS